MPTLAAIVPKQYAIPRGWGGRSALSASHTRTAHHLSSHSESLYTSTIGFASNWIVGLVVLLTSCGDIVYLVTGFKSSVLKVWPRLWSSTVGAQDTVLAVFSWQAVSHRSYFVFCRHIRIIVHILGMLADSAFFRSNTCRVVGFLGFSMPSSSATFEGPPLSVVCKRATQYDLCSGSPAFRLFRPLFCRSSVDLIVTWWRPMCLHLYHVFSLCLPDE